MSQLQRIVVIGGGISGLSFVHYLRNFLAASNKTNLIGKITLLESNDYLGGSIRTHSFGDGIVHELGPRSIRAVGVKSHNTVALVEQLGLGDKIVKIDDTSSAGRTRYVYRNGKLHTFPTSLTKVFTKFPGGKKRLISALIRDIYVAGKMDLGKYPDKDPPLYDFIAYRFGVDAAECFLDPIIRGITAGDCRLLSTRALFGDLLEKEQVYGSILRGMPKPPVTKMPHDDLFPNDILESKLCDKFQKDKVTAYNFSIGLQSIAERLSNSLLNTNEDQKVEIYNQSRVEKIKFQNRDTNEGPCCVTVKTVDGDELNIGCDHVVSATPSCDLAKVLPEDTPMQTKIALNNVLTIPHVPVGCVTVEYRNLKEPRCLDSFGFLAHSKEKRRILGIAFDSTMFPEIDRPHKSTRMTCMIGGHWFEQMTGTSDVNKVTDAQLEQISLDEIRATLKIRAEPHRMSAWLWKTGIAQYYPGHKERLAATREQLKELKVPLTLIGQSYDGIAVNDVIYGARLAADTYVKSL